MVDSIQKQLESTVKTPLLSMDTMYVSEVDKSIKKHLKTKQTITIHTSTLKEIVDVYGRGNSNYHDDFTDVEAGNFDNLKDGYGISEYFGGSGMYIPSPEYVMYMKDLSKDFIMNVYNGVKTNIPIPSVQNLIRKISDQDLPVGIEFPEVKNVNFTMFNGIKYQQGIRIGKYMYRFPILSLNLPYEFYSKQEIPEHIYTVDFDRQEYSLAGRSTEDSINLFNEICDLGIRKHLFMQIENGKIVSADDDAYAIMLIATYLKLPTIPVTLYMLNNDSTGNLLISNRQIDIMNKFHGNSRVATQEEVGLINELCDPYFVFFHKGYNDEVVETIMKSDYVPNKEVTGDTILDHTDVDFYLDELHQEPDIPEKTVTDEDTQKMHEEMMKEASQSISNDIEEYLRNMNSSKDQ
ncbi:MAG: hypothetical protein NC548_12725 [Lachnospiraceae bacterium]|nr:hypothetical protein [Lachnospiraceae bacterium]MCM1230746.1 hypothetical protein [Ruminococcus flavefaciens]